MKGLLGAITIRSAAAIASTTPGAGTRVCLAFEANPIDVVLVPTTDEPFLERERAGRRVDPRAQTIVGRGQQADTDAERRREAFA